LTEPGQSEGLSRAEFLWWAGGAALAVGVLGGGAAAADRLLASRRAATVEATRRVRMFHSRPDLRPPVVTIVARPEGTAPGALFLAPSSGPGQRGVMILDREGELVWFHSTAPKTAMNFRAALFNGKPVLTWWEALEKHALGRGEHVIFDDSYREIARFPAGDGLQSDLHEFLLTPYGTALVTSYEDRTLDLSAIGGSSTARVLGGIAQEIEVPSARVVFEWRSLDHVSPAESYTRIGHYPYDCFHINSIELEPDGDYVISARNTWAVYKVSRDHGKVVWRLNGKKTDFAMGKGTGFSWQHDARRHGPSLISIFDNADNPQEEPQSRAMTLDLDLKGMSATLVREYKHSPAVLSHAMGNAQLLPNGNVLVGWGASPYITEYAADGRVAFDAALPPGGENYRALRFPWAGRPVEAPALAARRAGASGELLASWNGSTDVAAWRVESGVRRAALSAGHAQLRRGFETSLSVPAGTRFAGVVALDRSGAVIGRSQVVSLA
jgi:hypothetical protein